MHYSSTLSLTSALDEGGQSVPCTSCATPVRYPVPKVQEAGWAPGPFWTVQKTLPSLGFKPQTTFWTVSLSIIRSLALYTQR